MPPKRASAKRGSAKRATAKRTAVKQRDTETTSSRRSKFEIAQRDVDKLQKQGMTLEQAAEELGVSASSLSKPYYQAEVNNDPDLEISGTAKQVAKKIVKFRDEGVRWIRLAVYSGKSIQEVKDIYSDETGVDAAESWTGRGRPPAGMTVEEARESIGIEVEENGASASKKRATTKRATAKRGGSKRTAKARTRAERQSKSNPS